MHTIRYNHIPRSSAVANWLIKAYFTSIYNACRCLPIPQDNTCFSQLSHTYFVPEIFDMSETIQREFRRILSPLPATDPCRGFFTSLSCVISFPACNEDTNKLLPICPNACPFIDALIATCLPLADLTTIPTLSAIFQAYNCTDPASYFMLPDQFYSTETCTIFGEFDIYHVHVLLH